MAKVSKYTHGKTKGTSDRQSSGRLSSAGGETSAPIKEFNITGSTSPSQPIRPSTNDYFQSQALSYPQAPTIKSFSEAPENTQNLKNLIDDLGQVNTKLQQFIPDFWNFQKAMDTAARKKAEKKAAESNTQLNAAKNALEKKAETDENASDSYGIFSSMDQRVERELVIVNAKNKGLTLISGFNDVALNDYNASSLDESRIDAKSGEIIPINPSTDEWSNYATNYFKDNIGNTAAYLELQPQIQAAIYSARRSVSKEHSTYKDNKANNTLNTSIGSTIIEASTASQEKLTGQLTEWTTDQDVDEEATVVPGSGMSFTGVINDFNQKSGTSIKNYRKQVEPSQLLTTIANGVILNSNTENLNDNADIALTLLKNTRIGAGEGQLLSEIVGGELALENMWELAIGAKRNDAQRIRDGNDKNIAATAARTDYANINQQDADLTTTEIDPILNGQGQRTVVVDGVEYYIDSGPNAINLSGVVGKIDQLLFDADKKFSTGIEIYEYRQELLRLRRQFLESRTAGQREENYQWLKKRITENPDQATLNKSLLNYFFRTDRISRDQYGLLEPDININYTNEKSIFNDEMNGKNGSAGKIVTATGYIERYYRDKTGMSMTSFDEWEPEDKNAYLARVARFKREANAIFLLPIPLEQRLEKLNQLTSDLDTEMKDASAKLKENKTGLSENNNVQVGTNKNLTTNNNQGNDNNNEGSTQFTYQTPKELIANLDGGLNGRGNDQQNSALVTAARSETLYSTPILVQQLNQFEDLAIVLKNKNMDGNNLRIWGWIQGVEGTTAVRGPRALSYTREMPAILGRINKDMSAKEFYLSQMKLHGLPITERHHEILDLIFPDERNSQFKFEPNTTVQMEAGNENAFNIENLSGQEIAQTASTDLTGLLNEGPPPLPPIINIKEVPTNLTGQQEASFDRTWEVDTPKEQRQSEFGNALYQAGFKDEEELTTMIAIAMAETNTRSIRNHTTLNDGDESYGVLQINMLDNEATNFMGRWREKKWPWLKNRNDLFDINQNAKAAYDIFKNEPWLNNGKEGLFNAWSSYENGKHIEFMDEARKIAKQIILNQSKPRHEESSTIGGRSNIA